MRIISVRNEINYKESMGKVQIPRVKLSLNKYETTWDGKVLRYLNHHHPGKKDGALVVMELVSAMWLPFAMRFFGASEAEMKEAALNSVNFLLTHACRIMSEFGLTSVVIPGVVVEPSSARIQPIYSSIGKVNAEYSSNGNSESNSTIEEVKGDDIEEDSFGLDSGFRLP